MESFYRTHKYLVEHLGDTVPRKLMTQINWSHRLIGIKGTRGVGKTTFLLDYARNYFDLEEKDCLYINLNHFYFTVSSIYEFAKQFVDKGGKVLLLDQIYKYPNWSSELKQCYEQFPELKIVFTVSTVMKLTEDESISSVVDVYNLRGFSYREFLNIQLNKELISYSLSDIIINHKVIVESINKEVNPNELFWDYLHHGYYPFFLEKKNFSENLLKVINMMLEVDVLCIRQIELSYLSKMRKLLYLLSLEVPCKPNISKLSIECGISRATVTNYIEYLKSARLINLLYTEGDEYPRKPDLVYMHNTNLLYPLNKLTVEEKVLHETFFYNQLHHNNCKLYKGAVKGLFVVEDGEGKYTFKVGKYRGKKKDDIIYTSNDNKSIPLWLFGFLY